MLFRSMSWPSAAPPAARPCRDYLLWYDHTSPFEQVVLTFHIKMPIFVARQWIRHRTARVNEISGRYSVMSDEFYVSENADVAKQSSDNKQGRSDKAPDPRIQTIAVISKKGFAITNNSDMTMPLSKNMMDET